MNTARNESRRNLRVVDDAEILRRDAIVSWAQEEERLQKRYRRHVRAVGIIAGTIYFGAVMWFAWSVFG